MFKTSPVRDLDLYRKLSLSRCEVDDVHSGYVPLPCAQKSRLPFCRALKWCPKFSLRGTPKGRSKGTVLQTSWVQNMAWIEKEGWRFWRAMNSK